MQLVIMSDYPWLGKWFYSGFVVVVEISFCLCSSVSPCHLSVVQVCIFFYFPFHKATQTEREKREQRGQLEESVCRQHTYFNLKILPNSSWTVPMILQSFRDNDISIRWTASVSKTYQGIFFLIAPRMED